MQSSPAPAHLPIEACSARWFYVWCLPTVWVFPIATLWSMTILESDPHYGILIALAEWPVLWLAGKVLDISSSNLDAAVAACVFGIAVMGPVGFFQDLLHVPHPKPIAAVYLIALLAAFFSVPFVLWPFGVPGFLEAMVGTLIFALVAFCNLVFVFGVGSIAVYALASVHHLLLPSIRNIRQRRKG